MNMLKIAPKLTNQDWTLIQFCLSRLKDPEPRICPPKHEILLWNKEIVLEAVHAWASYGYYSKYLSDEVELLKKLGWNGVRRDKKPA